MKTKIGKYIVETGDVGNSSFSLDVLSLSEDDESRLKNLKEAIGQINTISKGQKKDRQFLAGLEAQAKELQQRRQVKDYLSEKILRISISNSAICWGIRQQAEPQYIMIRERELDDFYYNICELAHNIATRSYLSQHKGFWGKLSQSLTLSIGSPLYWSYHIGKLWRDIYDVVVFECAKTALVSNAQKQKLQPYIEISEEEYPIDLFEQILKRFYLDDNQS